MSTHSSRASWFISFIVQFLIPSPFNSSKQVNVSYYSSPPHGKQKHKKHPLHGPNLFIFTNNRRINLDNLLKELLMFFSTLLIIYSPRLHFFLHFYILCTSLNVLMLNINQKDDIFQCPPNLHKQDGYACNQNQVC